MKLHHSGPALLLLAALIARPVAVSGADTITIRHAINSLTAVHWPDFVADAEGFNHREGLDVETVVLSADAVPGAVMGGSVEIGLINATQLALAVDKGSDVVAVGVGGDNQPYHLISVPAVKSFADLKGKTIVLAEQVNIYTEVVRAILKKHDLDMDTDVKTIFGPGQDQRLASIMSGAVQAGLFSPPADSLLISRGYNSLAFTPDYFPHLTLSVNAVNRQWAETHSDALRRFLRARAAAIQWLNNPTNQNQAIQLLMDRTKTTRAAAEAAYDYYIRKGKVFPQNGCVQRPGLDSLMHILKGEGRLTKLGANDAGKLMDPEWCPK